MQDEHIISSNITTSFSPNSCIIIKDFTKVDCSILFDQKANTTYSPPVFNDTNIYYSSLEQAIDECPFDPLLIEFAGTLYLQNESLVFYSSRDTIIRGHSSISTPSTLVGLKNSAAIAPIDGNFSLNSCIIIKNFTAIDCSILPDPEPNITNTIYCPGNVAVQPTPIIDGTQIYYFSLEQALAECPFDPVLIEFAGTLYVQNVTLVYPFARDLIIRGYSSVFFQEGYNVTTLVPTNVTTTVVVNVTIDTTTNITTNITADVTEEVLVEVVTSTVPDRYVTIDSAIVGFDDVNPLYQNISITFENFVAEGCYTDHGVFYTMACPEDCGDDITTYCQGNWYPKSINQTDEWVCYNTGAMFNNTQRISFQFANTTQNCQQNGFDTFSDGTQFRFTEEFTLEMWINPNRDNFRPFTGLATMRREGEDNNDGGWGFYYQNNGFLRWAVARPNDRQVLCAHYITPHTWTHIAGVWKSGLLEFYVNGALVCNDTGPFTTPYYNNQDDRPFTLGAGFHNPDGGNCDEIYFWEGLMDEVRLWNVARTSAQIENAYQTAVDYASPGLVLYMQFELGSTAFTNLAAAASTLPPPQLFYESYTPPIAPISIVPDCLCIGTECVPSAGNYNGDPNAPKFILSTDDINNYEFIEASIINPNGPYGLIWLPGAYNTTGTLADFKVRFWPGLHKPYPYNSPNTTIFFNTTTSNITVANSTTNETITSNYTSSNVTIANTTSNCSFVPGTNPSKLPPLDANPWINLDFFVPGWFFNGGVPPFSSFNFVPGIFVDKVFQPGILYENDTFVPLDPLSVPYILAMVMNNETTFDCEWLDECIIKNLTLVEVVPPPISVIQTDYGCTIGPNDIEPLYLDPLTRDPCYILRDIRNALNSDTFPTDLAHACVVGPYDIEPTYLDPAGRDPCYILRDLHALVLNVSVFKCNNGKVPVPPIYAPCLKNQNLTLSGMTFQNYWGEKVICQYACDEGVTLVMIQNNFTSIPGNAVWSSGLHHYDLHDNTFCPCGGMTPSCVYLNGNYISDGQYWIYNNRHCGIGEPLPVTCDYQLTMEISCLNGVLQCLDIAATLEQGCQQSEIAPGVLRFDDCAIYGPCECAILEQNVTMPDGSTQLIQEATGDINLWVPYVSPMLYSIFNGSDTVFIPCQTNTTLRNFTYTCFVDQNVTVVIDNVTLNITIQIPDNCTAELPVKTGTIGALQCPCPYGFVYGNITNNNLTGAAAAAALGIYSTCEWDIPNGAPGEVCKDGIVQCPYLGGQLGSNTPPPAPIGVCNAGTAILSCSTCNSTGWTWYEGKPYLCDPLCATGNVTAFSVSCECLDFYLTIPCNRDIQCIPDVLCNATLNTTLNSTSNSTYNPLCAITGVITYDNVPYPCYVLENETQCVGISYVPTQSSPPDGFTIIPCDNSYILPGPGPCSCLNDQVQPNNVTLAANSSCINSTDPNCTATQLSSSDPALQLICKADGTISCRCDGVYAINPFLGSNFTLYNTSAAFHIDHVNLGAEFFQSGNTAKDLPIGWRYTNFDYTLIKNSAINVLHFETDKSIMYESARLSKFITGTLWDWALGFDYQWNFRYCNSYDLGPDDGVYTNECKQYRPAENTSCVVDSTYTLDQTPFFGTLRFNRISAAMALDSCKNIIIHKAVNPYEEKIISTKDGVWIGSYNRAVIISSGHQMRADYVTLRGLVLSHTATNDFPLIQPTPITDQNFDTAFEGDPGKEPPVNCSILNCDLLGHNANKAGSVIGQFGTFFRFLYNYVDGFFARSYWVNSDFMEVRLNTFNRCPGRVVRIENVLGITFEENLFIDSRGLKGVRNLDFVSITAQGTLGRIQKQTIGKILFENFTDAEYELAFDIPYAESTLNPSTMGCNTAYDPKRICTLRGNRMVNSDDEDTAKSFDTIGYHLIGGNWSVEDVRDNVCTRARVGMAFYYCGIDYRDKDQIFYQNALIRTEDTYKRSDFAAADFAYRPWGSLVSIGCYFPNCWSPNVSWPVMEANPQFNLIVSEAYGFKTINNLTAASRWSRPMYMINVTSEKAILRREQILLKRDIFAVGFKDPLCCARPIIYGSGHTLSTEKAVMDFLEFRFEMVDQTFDATGEKLWETPARYMGQDLRFYDIWFNGHYTIGSGRVKITNVYLDPKAGTFIMNGCKIFNWWHYPMGTTRGMYISSRGAIPVVVLPDRETIYYTERSPAITGIHIYFQKPDRRRRSRFGRNTKKNPFIDIDSVAVIRNNKFYDMDGTALSISTPGNWDIQWNEWIDCGMRQPSSEGVVILEGNVDSVGVYIFENNYINTTKPYLFPTFGGGANMGYFSGVNVFGMRFPSVFVFRNNTVALNTNETTTIDTSAINEAELFPRNAGLFDRGGPIVLNKYYGPSQNKKKPKPNTWDAADIANRNVDPNSILTGTNGDPELFLPQDKDSYQDPVQKLTPLSGEFTYREININKKNVSGYAVGVRFDLPHQVLVKTLAPGASNYSLSAFFQPQFIPYRIVSLECGSKTADILADGTTVVPTNGPGIQGIYADMVGACNSRKDRLQSSFSQCIICNDGCPVYPPTTCVVDGVNATFVPENPYYGKWLFKTLGEALANCKDPNRKIEVVYTPFPYVDNWNIIYSNYTIFSTTKASILVSSSVVISAHSISISGITFIHNLGNSGPTLIASSNLFDIAIVNSTFKGSNTQQSAILGSFMSFALSSTEFVDYRSSPTAVVHITSPCGVLVLINNTFLNTPNIALRAEKYKFLTASKNRFLNCGRLGPYCSYISMCKNETGKLVFTKNVHKVTIPPAPHTNRYASFWLDGVDILSGNTSASYKGPDLSFNQAEGLDIGLRVTNIDDASTGIGALFKRATVAYLTYQQKNMDVTGTWHYIVVGPPSKDYLIDQDPIATEEFYCDNDCNNSSNYVSLVIALSSVFGFFLFYCIICNYPRSRNLYDENVVWSSTANRWIALDPYYNDEAIRRNENMGISGELPAPPTHLHHSYTESISNTSKLTRRRKKRTLHQEMSVFK